MMGKSMFDANTARDETLHASIEILGLTKYNMRRTLTSMSPALALSPVYGFSV